MAVLALDGSNPDISLLYDINGLAKGAPSWFDRAVAFFGDYGILLALVVVVLACWLAVRRRGSVRDSVSAVAGLLWAPLAAGAALLLNVPVRGFVGRPRPFVDHKGVDVLLSGQHGFSFVSGQATLAMAVGVGLFVVHRKYGLVAIGLAVLEGFTRVYLGVHYPTDVIGGFALGTAVALLLTPVAMAVLTPLASAVAASGRFGRLVRSRRAGAGGDATESEAGSDEDGGPTPYPADTRGLGLSDTRPDDTNLAA
ncbi:phosphatase PAP2 family protein [Streptomyces fuscigenes]|uniref:phosphatase PAP2 family protein n=1 Tax=Streptomyces fuscigenes TaxID=1528880 RepID=UPI001F422891|nr:phosphatase PAP2 family protein [Streptomyces fuscigenes]MCF3964078.1 phosphatase PAP2 family protein [Streptomyces fuscigenes]